MVLVLVLILVWLVSMLVLLVLVVLVLEVLVLLALVLVDWRSLLALLNISVHAFLDTCNNIQLFGDFSLEAGWVFFRGTSL